MFLSLQRIFKRFAVLIITVTSIALLTTAVQAEATGPDAWRLSGDNSVTMRMGPSLDYPAIGTLPAHARHLIAITCVPLFTQAQFEALNPQMRHNLPPRWCLVKSNTTKGWVAQRHLREDTVRTAESHSSKHIMPGDDAVAVARAFLASYTKKDGSDKLYHHPEWAQQYFRTDLADRLTKYGFGDDTLYGGQDRDISDMQIREDPDQPPLMGRTVVLVTYRNWGKLQHMRLYLRSDPKQDAAQRIFKIETADGRTID